MYFLSAIPLFGFSSADTLFLRLLIKDNLQQANDANGAWAKAVNIQLRSILPVT